jgi:hypothetical protein
MNESVKPLTVYSKTFTQINHLDRMTLPRWRNRRAVGHLAAVVQCCCLIRTFVAEKKNEKNMATEHVASVG